MELGPRDRLSQAFVKEEDRGNVFEGPHGTYVHLDIRHLGEKRINQKIPFVRELTKNYVGIDPVHEPIPVRPVVHYMMGGIDTGPDAATSLPGLFAAGECACVSINGANRLGSNSLVEILVFGALAGRTPHDGPANIPFVRRSLTKQADKEQTRIARDFINNHDGQERSPKSAPSYTLDGVRLWHLSHRRDAARDHFQAGRAQGTLWRVKLDDHSLSFNTELMTALELGCLIELAEAIAHSALRRTESRGSHQRMTFPTVTMQFLKHSLASARMEPRIDYRDVVITNWPPGERVYGRDH